MSEPELAKKIAQQLNRSLSYLDQTTLSGLQTARAKALRSLPVHQEAFAQAQVGPLPARLANLVPHNPRLWMGVGILALVVAMFGVTYWQQSSQSEPESIDAGLLAGDLPLHAYMQPDFQKWLKEAH